PTSFLSKGILREVTRHVVVNDQAGLPFQVTVTRRTELYSRRCLFPTFTNCLVAMRPKTMREELPTCTTVRTNIKNEYARYMEAI
ncbi:hypothetical protein C8Q72DRAFT_766776, partial [Fomitopsis betulina]